QPIPGGAPPVFEGSRIIYRVPGLPRATVVGEYRVAHPARAILDSVAVGTLDAARGTWLEKDPGLKLDPVEGAQARIVRYGLNDVTIDVETPGPALLRLATSGIRIGSPRWTDGRSRSSRPTTCSARSRSLPGDTRWRSTSVPVRCGWVSACRSRAGWSRWE